MSNSEGKRTMSYRGELATSAFVNRTKRRRASNKAAKASRKKNRK